jgi:hypothetical protein
MIKGGGYTRIEDTQRLVTEIEMLKVVFYLVNIKKEKEVDLDTFYCTTT